MKRLVCLFVFALGCTGSPSLEHFTQSVVSTSLVISQVYGGGGSPGASWRKDYVELFNLGAAPVDLNGWSLQYGSQTANLALQVDITTSTVVQPNQYFLIALGSSGSNGATVPADLVAMSAGAFNISNADGKVALVSSTTTLSCGSPSKPCSSADIVDLVGYGEGSAFEGAAAVSPSGVNGAIYRAGGGCIDTDHNDADFAGATAVPRNQATALHLCNVDGGTSEDLGEDLAGVESDLGAGDLATSDLATPDLATGPPPVSTVVISQLYGAGGESGASYRNDFVELFNRGDLEVDLSNWSLQYASKDNTFSLEVVIPSGTVIPAGGYFLIRLSSGGNTGATVAEPDLTVATSTNINISASAGKLALVNQTALVGCGSVAKPCTSPAIVDLVGYGDASAYEGAPAGAPDDALFRKLDGCQDTDHNDADFSGAAAAPRNSASPINVCSGIAIDASVVDTAVIADADVPSDDASVTNPVDLARAADGSITKPTDLASKRDLADPTVPQGRAKVGCGCDLESGGTMDGSPFLLAALVLWRLRRRGVRA